MKGKYDDIINLPHHVSSRHPQMSISDRAAQFSPFKALSGYESDIEETARLTDSRIELAEDEKERLERKLNLLVDVVKDSPIVAISYFQLDSKKAGGTYISIVGIVKKIDSFENVIVMQDGLKIEIKNVTKIELM